MELRRMSCCSKLRQKDYCLNSSATIGSDNSLTPLTPELNSLTPLTPEMNSFNLRNLNNIYEKQKEVDAGCTNLINDFNKKIEI